MATLTGSLYVADLAALKAVPETERTEGSFRHVAAVVDANYRFDYQKYFFKASGGIGEALPAIVAPNSGSGVWIAENLPIVSDILPSAAPDLANREYVAVLATPDRVVRWRSPLVLSASPTVTDWTPDFEPINIATTPTFNADFVGQRVVALDTGTIYKATDLSGTWVAL